jgi:hypothetical protein
MLIVNWLKRKGEHMITFEMIRQAKMTLHNLVYIKWIVDDVFSPKWWGFVALIAFSYILCFSLLDKRRFTQILLFGSLITVLTIVFDIFGSNFDLWSYKSRLIPTIPSPVVYDLTIVPLYYMLAYQYSRNWKTFFIWNAVTAGIIGFAYFPFLSAIQVVVLGEHWSYFGFFAVNFIFAIIARTVVVGIMTLESKHLNSYSLDVSLNVVSQPAMKPLVNDENIKDD